MCTNRPKPVFNNSLGLRRVLFSVLRSDLTRNWLVASAQDQTVSIKVKGTNLRLKVLLKVKVISGKKPGKKLLLFKFISKHHF